MTRIKFKNSINIYLFFTGLMGHIVLVIAFLYIMNIEQLSARLLVKKSIDTLGIDIPVVIIKLLQPNVKNGNFPLDGEVNKRHPRIVLPQLMHWDGVGVSPFIKQRIFEHRNNKAYLSNCGSGGLMPSVACWLATNDSELLRKIIIQMLNYELNVPTADTTYSNGWQLALAYDLVFSALNEKQRGLVEHKISKALEATLLNLDEDSASLWHGRSTHAAIAWLCAVVLSDRVDQVDELQRRAQGHFLNAIDALAYTAVWPSGYNYWIQSRALTLALASSAYLNGLSGAENSEKVKEVMRQVGYWTLYATRPDKSIEGFGDEGSRVDLKDESRRVIDLIVQMTQDSVLAGYSKFLANLHGVESYYSAHRWGFLLFNDPFVGAVGDGTLTIDSKKGTLPTFPQ